MKNIKIFLLFLLIIIFPLKGDDGFDDYYGFKDEVKYKLPKKLREIEAKVFWDKNNQEFLLFYNGHYFIMEGWKHNSSICQCRGFNTELE